ncbi:MULTISPECIES: ABC transporter substrate-binding protein [unclassified Burkholderia]|uniref:ABC transporter substrate-binding protein n=1 Tax=unclassified Burkholderia TaxID=2613784 RepID=UPI000F565A2C|nr:MULTISPECIES: ABC transporter substrate-binding protein [unclassified Burkholderia]RQR75143.1 amino acid ABC transporter substrate-binding protein [Burkholderia sp. Bp9011]RQR86171.1 amino acid ABC transporter substrate-binding protein [Burkholderia sp. Bp9010]RQS00954.1 amino acid ABC transporter substrate-binding protein [Burkholderia sp. Bp8991]RQS67582.1 amino acid ABC transporter substrate-binding protein [Burkholderia sp. Bp8977]
MNLFSGRAACALLAWFREFVPERRCLHRLLRRAACVLVTVSCATPALALDESAPAAPAAVTAPATTATGLVQMPDGRLLAPEFARIVTRGTLVVAVLGVDQPPFFMSRNGALAGVDIDLADELAKKLGVPVQFDRDARTFDDVVHLLATGQADVAISKLSRTLPRAQVVRFSTPYISLRRALLINRVGFAELAKGRPLPEVVRDYRGTIGVVAGSAYAEYARNDFPAARVRTYPSWPATLDALNAGAVTAVYRDELAIKLVMQDDPTAPIRLRVATFDDLTDALAVGVPVSMPTLLAFVNQFLAERNKRLDVKSLLDAMCH